MIPYLIIIPLLGAFAMPLMGLAGRKAGELWAVIVTLLTFGVSIDVFNTVWKKGILVYTLGAKSPIGKGVDFPVRIVWEVDLLGALLALVVAFVTLVVVVYSIEYMKHDTGLEKYYTLVMLLEVGMLGIAMTGDLFNFYVFFEITGIASYALVAFRNDTWEGIEAGIKYMFAGSLASSLVLLGVVLLYGQYGTLTMAYLSKMITGNPTFTSRVALGLLIGGLLFKSGAVPVHMWLADAHPAAPSSISAMLSGLVIKLGGVYAITRLAFSVFGGGTNLRTLGWVVILFACATLIVGNAMAVVQTDMKRLLAYSSVGQIGYILLGVGIGLAAYGSEVGNVALAGAIYHTVNHALIKALLFLIAGAVIHNLGTRNLNELSGIARRMPITSFAFLVGAMAIIGVPPMNGFASKWLIYESSALFNPLVGVIAIIGTAFSFAAYIRVVFTFLGRPCERVMQAQEPGKAMLLPMLILVAAIVLTGLFPWIISDRVMLPAAKMLENTGNYVSAVLGGA
ncbi:cation:proton antiporter [Thermococcus sp. P6]|uniref:proton-conducting transporter transmembrane domain-containing protein n=1 Tax=Thermococcus sp. P6 TaxID=122420 RepID=UPI000B59EA49|nr:proton-conducting transporter membrane subunit [Thermococcus sp. P6]ASJ10606.1 cation:proton antiporter [Thermococcus sp. P6]